MPVTAISDQNLDRLIDSSTRCEEDVGTGVAGLNGRLPLHFYQTIFRCAAPSTWAYYYLIYQTLPGALGGTYPYIRISWSSCFFPKLSSTSPGSLMCNSVLTTGDWPQLAKMHMLLQPPNTHLSSTILIPILILSIMCLISCLHNVACPITILPSLIRVISLPNSLGNLEAATPNTHIGQKSSHWLTACFIASAPPFPLKTPSSQETINHNWGKNRGLSCYLCQVGQEVQHHPAIPPVN